MILLALSLLASSVGAGPARPVPDDSGIEIAESRLTIIQSRIIRIPARRVQRSKTPPKTPVLPAFQERRGPHCIDAEAIAGAAITAASAVDIILKGGARVRAVLEDECPALDYYSGFYVQPGKDAKICAGRDSIRTRSGGDCQINRFRKLVPAKP